jgi:hypothetical protein
MRSAREARIGLGSRFQALIYCHLNLLHHLPDLLGKSFQSKKVICAVFLSISKQLGSTVCVCVFVACG